MAHCMSSLVAALPKEISLVEHTVGSAIERIRNVRQTLVRPRRTRSATPRAISKQAWLRCLSVAPQLWALRAELDKCIEFLRSDVLHELAADQIRPIAHDMSQTRGRMRRLFTEFRDLGIDKSFPYSVLLKSLESRDDSLSSILEGLYMAIDEDFGNVLRDVITEFLPQDDICGSSVDGATH